MRKKKKKEKTLLWQLSAVAVFLILVSLGYQRFEEKLPTLTKTVKRVPRASNKPVVQAEAVVAPIAQMELLDTSDWQTYTSEYTYHEEAFHFNEGSYAYTFNYPPNWSVLYNDLGNECERIDVTAPEGYGVIITKNCDKDTYAYQIVPSGSVDIKQYEKVGDDGSTEHIIRVFDEDKKNFIYTDIFLYENEEVLSNKSKYKGGVVFFDIPMAPAYFDIHTVGINDPAESHDALLIIDNIIYSFTSLKR